MSVNPPKDQADSAPPRLRLGVNIDHVATLRNARGGRHPDPLYAAELAIAAGADGITAHLREDRRHIGDDDIARLKARISKPLNLEMAATAEMVEIALKTKPHAVCIVPERREERTTEGGLDVLGQHNQIVPVVQKLKMAGIRVSLFIAADQSQIEMAVRSGAPVIEIHTGHYADARDAAAADAEFARIVAGVEQGRRLGLIVNAGHGLHFGNTTRIAALAGISELNIGHALVAEAVFRGWSRTISDMKALMVAARAGA